MFVDIPLYLAVYRVYNRTYKAAAEKWISSHAKTTYKLVLQQIVDDEAWSDEGIPWSMNRVVDVWRQLRKQKRLRLTCQVVKIHGAQCFYARRGVGDCSSEVDLDRIIPGNRGGRYTLNNCVIACSFHNRSRGDQSIEEYLEQGQPTQLKPETTP